MLAAQYYAPPDPTGKPFGLEWATRGAGILSYFSFADGITVGSTLPQFDETNLALNVLSIVTFIGVPFMLPVTVVWLVPLK